MTGVGEGDHLDGWWEGGTELEGLPDWYPEVTFAPADSCGAANMLKVVDDRSSVAGGQLGDLSVEGDLTVVGAPGSGEFVEPRRVEISDSCAGDVLADERCMQVRGQRGESLLVLSDEAKERGTPWV